MKITCRPGKARDGDPISARIWSPPRDRLTSPSAGEIMKPRIAVLIPAHNEQGYIAETIRGIRAQSRPADRIIVVPNNCREDDATAAIAAGLGAEVIELHGITGRKAGALNAALDIVLPQLDADDLVVCMDADTTIHPDLLKNAEAHFAADSRLGAVSSNHLVEFKRTP